VSLLSVLLALAGIGGPPVDGSVVDSRNPASTPNVRIAVGHGMLLGVVRHAAQLQNFAPQHPAPPTAALPKAGSLDLRRSLDGAVFEQGSDGSLGAVGLSVRFRGPPSGR
jgi:hypothetical protein